LTRHATQRSARTNHQREKDEDDIDFLGMTRFVVCSRSMDWNVDNTECRKSRNPFVFVVLFPPSSAAATVTATAAVGDTASTVREHSVAPSSIEQHDALDHCRFLGMTRIGFILFFFFSRGPSPCRILRTWCSVTAGTQNMLALGRRCIRRREGNHSLTRRIWSIGASGLVTLALNNYNIIILHFNEV